MKKFGKSSARALASFLCVLLLSCGSAANAALCDAAQLIPLGNAAGISLSTEGVLVVGLSGVQDGEETRYPARDAGICEGDLILSIDGTPIHTAADLQQTMEKAGEQTEITVRRDGNELTLTVEPIQTEDGLTRIGIWIRDSMLGIGTLTFYDPQSGVYGALGHGINEKNSGDLLSIAGGDLLQSTIERVKRGEAGAPGELQGTFEPESKIGSVLTNTTAGIFGMLTHAPEGKAIPVAKRDQVKLGEAEILSSVEGGGPCRYDIRICALYRTDDGNHRDMLIEVTDPDLIEKTGGIVQGMSGSPILQDGKIIGAVTHVLIHNPRKGYGILIENMLSAYDAGEDRQTADWNRIAA